MPEEPLGQRRRRRSLQKGKSGAEEENALPINHEAETRLLLADPTPQSCFEVRVRTWEGGKSSLRASHVKVIPPPPPPRAPQACSALFAPDNSLFLFNLYPSAETGDIMCTCCRDCLQARSVFGAEVYGTCITGPAYYASITGRASRKMARPKAVITYTVRVKPTAQTTAPYIMQVTLPSGVTYVKGRATGLVNPPVLSPGSNGATLVTWDSVSPRKTKTAKDAHISKPMTRTFTVKARVQKGVAKGTALAFDGTLYQVNEVTDAGIVCGRSANSVTVRMSGIMGPSRSRGLPALFLPRPFTANVTQVNVK